MSGDLTRGPIAATMLFFALPMMLGNLLQQCYNVADTLIVGRFLGASALAAVGSSYTLMTFLTSILLGLCMGSGAVFSICHGAGDRDRLQRSLSTSFLLIGGVTLILNLGVFLLLDPILALLQVPLDTRPLMREYLWVIFWGIAATFLYNYFASLLRAVGNSLAPLLFLAVCALLNIALDLVFVLVFRWGVAGAAAATVLSQYVSGLGIGLYTWVRCPQFRPSRSSCRIRMEQLREIAQFSFLTSLQQSVMNFGILLVQGLINSFGTIVMAAFAAAVKIDSFAYMPVQDFGNAFSTFVAQNYGARKGGRIRAGIRSAVAAALLFCAVISAAVCLFARPLMLLFVQPGEEEDRRHRRAVPPGGGGLLLRHRVPLSPLRPVPGGGPPRDVPGPHRDLLGTRVLLAYTLSAIPAVGVLGCWLSVPIGWLLADLAGLLYYRRRRAVLFAGLEDSAA